MHNEHNVESAEIWRAAQHLRTEDIAKWLSHFLKRSEQIPGADIAQLPFKPRLALTRGNNCSHHLRHSHFSFCRG
jgi:hypothetical protein